MLGVFNKRIKTNLLLFAIIVTGSLFSCSQDEISLTTSHETAAKGYLQIHLNASDMRYPDGNKTGTRAMDEQAEKRINPDLLNVLIFKYDEGSSSEKFCYKAPISGTIRIDETNQDIAIITVKLSKSLSPDEKYRIMVICNYDLSNITMTEDITEKTDILNQSIYSVSEKWSTGTLNYTPFPMWGETEPTVISEKTPFKTIDLYRALAKIDVGLNFKSESGKLTDEVYGLNEFKLKEIKVYRTYDKGFVAPINSISLNTTPSIPYDAARRDDDTPINYSIHEAAGSDSYVREIYIPEADVPVAASTHNTHCIVIGGYYKGSPTVTYYRLDFAEETSTGELIFLPVLRNHRYVFNITQVSGPGYTTSQAALKSSGNSTGIKYEQIVWDEQIHLMEVQGKYYFGLSGQSFRFNPNADQTNTVRYQTNLPTTENISFDWENGSSSVFEVSSRNFSTHEFTIKTKSTNVSNAVITDTLYVKSGPFRIPIYVEQSYIN